MKAAIKGQQDQQIENALLAEGRPYYDLELTEKEIERIVMEASREEYLNQQQVNFRIIKGQGQSHLLLPQTSTSGCVVRMAKSPLTEATRTVTDRHSE